MIPGLVQKLLFTKKGLIAIVSIASLVGIAIAAAFGRYEWAMFSAGLLITTLGIGGRATVKTELFTFVAGAGIMLMVLPFAVSAILQCAGP